MTKPTRTLSPEARARISAAQKARWRKKKRATAAASFATIAVREAAAAHRKASGLAPGKGHLTPFSQCVKALRARIAEMQVALRVLQEQR